MPNTVQEATGAAIPDATLKGYVAEGQRTNLLTYSEQFDNASWAKNRITVSANSMASPAGNITADTITAITPTTGLFHYAEKGNSLSATTYTVSMYAKAGTRTFAALYGEGAVGGTARGAFDLVNGTSAVIANAVSTSITNVGSGWYRCSLTWTVATPAVYYIGIGGANSLSSDQYEGDGTTLYLWGAQLEQASFASSYIPTTTASVTRNAGLHSRSVSNILATQGSLYFEFKTDRTPIGTIFFFGSYLDASNYLAVLHDGTNLIARKRVAGVNYDSTIANSFAAGTNYKVGVVWTTAKLAVFLNGTKGTQDNTAVTAVLGATTFEIGSDGNGANHAFANIGRFKTWKNALTDAQLIGLTS